MEVDFAHKIDCHGNVPRGIEKVTSDRSSTAEFYQMQQWHSIMRNQSSANFVKIGLVDVEIIGLTNHQKYFLNKTSPKH